MPSKKIAWKALEHDHKEKSSDWFWIVGIVAIAGAILSVYFENLLFGILILLAGFTAILQGHTKPRIMNIEITRKGVRIDDLIYPYSSLQSFWVIDEEINDRILIRSSKPLMPIIVLPFDSTKVDPDEIRDYLLDYLDEEELDEPFFQKIMELFGF